MVLVGVVHDGDVDGGVLGDGGESSLVTPMWLATDRRCTVVAEVRCDMEEDRTRVSIRNSGDGTGVGTDGGGSVDTDTELGWVSDSSDMEFGL